MENLGLEIGETYFVENGNGKSFLGELVAVLNPFTVSLRNCVWVANTGRYHLFCKGQFDDNCELEPALDQPCATFQNIGKWPYPIPKEPK